MQNFDGQLRETVNGGGMVTSFVFHSKTSIIEPKSKAEGYAEIYDSAVIAGESTIRDYAKAFDRSTLRDSILKDYARISGECVIDTSIVSGIAEIYGQASLFDCVVEGNVVICGKAVVSNSRIRGNVRIGEQATVYGLDTSHLDTSEGITIIGNAVIDFDRDRDNELMNKGQLKHPQSYVIPVGARLVEGVWRRAPKVIDTDYFICTEGVNDRMLIGCLDHSINLWLSPTGYETCIKYGFNDDMYKQFREAVLEMKAYKKAHPSPKQRKTKDRYIKGVPEYEIEAAQQSDANRL